MLLEARRWIRLSTVRVGWVRRIMAADALRIGGHGGRLVMRMTARRKDDVVTVLLADGLDSEAPAECIQVL